MIEKFIFLAHMLPTEINNGTGLLTGMSNWAYQVTNGLFFVAMLIAFCFVLFISTMRYGTARAFGFAGFTAIMGSILLATAKLMSWGIASAFILAGAVSLVILINSEK